MPDHAISTHAAPGPGRDVLARAHPGAAARLVYAEPYEDIEDALVREKRLKG